MKISERLKASIREGNPTIRYINDLAWRADSLASSSSLPKLLRYSVSASELMQKGLQNLYDRMDRMAILGPQFIDVCFLSPDT